MRWFLDLLYGSTPVEFESSFEVEESIARLKAASGRTFLSALTRQRAVGTVEESRVCLRREIPMCHNSFKPFFIGSFGERNGRVILVGRFTMLWFVKVFMSFWFGFCALWTTMALFSLTFLSFARLPNTQPNKWWFPLFGILMFCAGTALLRFGKWFSRNDAVWLSEVIKKALSDKISEL